MGGKRRYDTVNTNEEYRRGTSKEQRKPGSLNTLRRSGGDREKTSELITRRKLQMREREKQVEVIGSWARKQYGRDKIKKGNR